MKKILVVLLLFTGSISLAQEGVKVDGSKVTVKETAPVWPGCENSEDQKQCFNQKLMQHIKENYKYPRNEAGDFLRGKATIALAINEKGSVVVRSVKGENSQINAAAETMIKKIPKMKPGMRGGKPTSIKYTIPLTL
ncbi:energy transducer TonB [Salegentibacter sp. F188]|uniref:Energy transducer TonB n=1 Tax=Autumnicola patrickiae TaxID=3075591 RepID=A0ABU3E0I3_9FLAO|nr:energy transducer TonB [Salegentibacter sp. F188]MDT0689189.1 energy transducer TonB [Salegentibacter sp. F188]